jgi:hypothetical protein
MDFEGVGHKHSVLLAVWNSFGSFLIEVVRLRMPNPSRFFEERAGAFLFGRSSFHSWTFALAEGYRYATLNG